MDLSLLESRARSLVEGLLDDGSVFIVDFRVRGSRGSIAVDLFVESDEALGADQLANLSRELGFVLDTEDIIPGPYTLAVSTPGADRPLRLPRQFRKHVGRTLRVQYRLASGKCTEVCGRLLDASQRAISIEGRKSIVDIGFSDIQWAKVQLPW